MIVFDELIVFSKTTINSTRFPPVNFCFAFNQHIVLSFFPLRGFLILSYSERKNSHFNV